VAFSGFKSQRKKAEPRGEKKQNRGKEKTERQSEQYKKA
jgi:hypothetical protein